MKILCVIDCQNDFITGSLGSMEAQAIVPYICEKIKGLNYETDDIITTFDTHNENYLQTLEGKKLPVEHCIFNTHGWMLNTDIYDAMKEKVLFGNDVLKPTFGSIEDLPNKVKVVAASKVSSYDDVEIEICGLCTDICVVSNALILRAMFPNVKITCDAKACAGTSIEAHKAALTVMKSCQIDVINEN